MFGLPHGSALCRDSSEPRWALSGTARSRRKMQYCQDSAESSGKCRIVRTARKRQKTRYHQDSGESSGKRGIVRTARNCRKTRYRQDSAESSGKQGIVRTMRNCQRIAELHLLWFTTCNLNIWWLTPIINVRNDCLKLDPTMSRTLLRKQQIANIVAKSALPWRRKPDCMAWWIKLEPKNLVTLLSQHLPCPPSRPFLYP